MMKGTADTFIIVAFLSGYKMSFNNKIFVWQKHVFQTTNYINRRNFEYLDPTKDASSNKYVKN